MCFQLLHHGSGNSGGQEVFRERQKFAPVAAGKEAVVANAYEAARQHMKQESAEKLIVGKRHEPLLVFVSNVLSTLAPGVSPAESNLAVGE